jgi:opacity protein-like surface antigen
MTRIIASLVLLGGLWAGSSHAAVRQSAPAPGRMAAGEETADSLEASDLVADSLEAAALARDHAGHAALEPLVPELAAHPYRLTAGVPDFRHRLSLSPGYGFLGSDHLYAFRVTYDPGPWFGYEASLAHNPGHAVHAMLHTLSAIVRRPLTGRFQPYLSGGYGMMIVFPGQTVNAAPVTKNTLTIGAGLEFYIRNDLALRADLRQATILGQQRNRAGTVAYDYAQGTIGLAFYRTVRP